MLKLIVIGLLIFYVHSEFEIARIIIDKIKVSALKEAVNRDKDLCCIEDKSPSIKKQVIDHYLIGKSPFFKKWTNKLTKKEK